MAEDIRVGDVVRLEMGPEMLVTGEFGLDRQRLAAAERLKRQMWATYETDAADLLSRSFRTDYNK